MWQGFDIACLMRTHCKPQRGLLTFIMGTVLGATIGCTFTLTYIIQLNNNIEKTEYERLPRMILDPIISSPVSVTTTGKQAQPLNYSRSTSTSPMIHSLKTKEDFLLASVDKMSFLQSHRLLSYKTYRLPYLVIVMATNSQVSKIETIYDTWGRDVTGIKFFVQLSDENRQLNSEGVPVVQLQDSSISSEWTIITTAIKHIYKNYYDKYNWFVFTLDNVYINGHGLRELLSGMDPEVNVYLGHPEMVSWRNKPFSYCSGQLGVILSRRLIRDIVLSLDRCKEYHGRKWDQALGHCVRRMGSIQCSHDKEEVAKYFSMDVNGYTQSIEHLWQDPSFLKALTLAPVYTEEHMYTLHYFYKLKQLEGVRDKVSKIKEELRQVCQNLPQVALENYYNIQDICVSLKPQATSLREDDQGEEEKERSPNLFPSGRFHPRDRFQVQAWNYFDALNIYEGESITPRRSLKTYKYHSMELQEALQEVVKVASREERTRLRFKKLTNGYVRHNPLLGNEYIIDAMFVEARNPRKKLEKRIRLLRPLSTTYNVRPSKSNSSETVHFVVPITGVTHRFAGFLKMYENLVFIPRESVHLVLAVYGEEDVQQILQNASAYFRKYPKADITIVQGYGEFSRAKALDLGMSKLKNNDLAFFCDVDMSISPQFLSRCRRNAAQGQSVYYPEVFKLYNRKYVYRNEWHPRKYRINREQGHWGHYAYGMLCIYKSDYIAVGGLDVGMLGWGGEDVDLYERVLRSGLDVLRAPDTGLVHRWHSKSCRMESSTKMLEHCLMSQSEVLADRRELARYIFDTQGQDEEK